MALELPEDVGSDVDSLTSETTHEDEDPMADRRHLQPPRGPVHFMEIFSNPRVAPHVRLLGMSHGPSIDLGTGWDLLRKSCQIALLELISILCPLVLMLSPPCTVFSQVQKTMEGRRKSQDKWEQEYADGVRLWVFACALFKHQLEMGRTAIMEHPWLAGSWNLPITLALRARNTVYECVFDQCLLGLVTTEEKKPVRKRTKFLTNAAHMDAAFFRRCAPETCTHPGEPHAWLQGSEGGKSRCRSAQTYPPEFCRRLAVTVQNEMQGHFQVIQPAMDDDEMDLELPSEVD